MMWLTLNAGFQIQRLSQGRGQEGVRVWRWDIKKVSILVITRQMVSAKLFEYLNQQITLVELVDRAENSFIDSTLAPDSDTDLLNDILGYLTAADRPQFPLTWGRCAEFMTRLGVSLRVVSAQSLAQN
jgi:hypothetical protein